MVGRDRAESGLTVTMCKAVSGYAGRHGESVRLTIREAVCHVQHYVSSLSLMLLVPLLWPSAWLSALCFTLHQASVENTNIK